MREILFRGKRVDNGEWEIGYLVTGEYYLDREPMTVIMPFDLTFYPRCEVGGWEEVIPATVGQFTGLTDANEKKIFEGDFVRMKYAVNGRKRTFIKGVVKYENGAFLVYYYSHGRQTQGLLCGFTNSFHTEDEGLFCEVIGNIHDNPELLEAV